MTIPLEQKDVIKSATQSFNSVISDAGLSGKEEQLLIITSKGSFFASIFVHTPTNGFVDSSV